MNTRRFITALLCQTVLLTSLALFPTTTAQAATTESVTINPNGGIATQIDGSSITSSVSRSLGSLIAIGETKSFDTSTQTIDFTGTYSFDVQGGKGGNATIIGLGTATGGNGVRITSNIVSIDKGKQITFRNGATSNDSVYPNIDYNYYWKTGSIVKESNRISASYGDSYNGVDIGDFLYIVWGDGGNCSSVSYDNYSIYAAGGGAGTVFSYAYKSSPIWAGVQCLSGKSAPLDTSDMTADISGISFDSDLAFAAAHGNGKFINGSGLHLAYGSTGVGNGGGYKNGQYGAYGANAAVGGTCGQSHVSGFTTKFEENITNDSYVKMTCHSKTFTIANPVRSGYSFSGWTVEGAGVSYTNNGTSCTFIKSAPGSMSLKANWTRNSNGTGYKAIMDLNDGTNTPVILNSLGLYYGNMIDCEWNKYWNSFTYTPARTGFTFAGWYDSATGGNLVYNPANGAIVTGNKYWTTEVVNGIVTYKYQYKGNMTLYAHWTPITYYVSYNGNGADQGAMNNSTHSYYISQKLSKNQYITSRTIAYKDGINNSSSTMFAIPDTKKLADFLGWKANVKNTNQCILNQYVTSLGNVSINDSGTVVIDISDIVSLGSNRETLVSQESRDVNQAHHKALASRALDSENVGVYQMQILSKTEGTGATINGNRITVDWNAASCDPKIDLLVTVKEDSEYEAAYARYQLFGKQAVTVTLDYNTYGTGSATKIESFLNTQYGNRLPTAKDVHVYNKSDTFVCWTTERNNIKTKVSPTDYVSGHITKLYAYYDHDTTVETPLQIFTYNINYNEKTITITGLTNKGRSLEYLVIPDYYWVNGEKFAVTGLSWTYGGTNNPAAPNTVLKYMYVSGKTATVTIGTSIDVERPGIYTLSNGAFAGCVNLKSCYFGGELSIIPDGCFENCLSLENVYIGNKVRKIQKYAFYNCVGLRNLLIPDNVTDLTEGMVVHNKSALGNTNDPTRNSALSNVYVSQNAVIRDVSGEQRTYSLCPHQGYSIHTVFYSGCSEAVINSHAGGHAWWRYTLNNASETNTGYIAPYAQMSAAEFYARFLNTAAYNDMLAGFPNRPTNAYEYEYINR